MAFSVPVGEVQAAFSNETTDEQFAKKYHHSKPNMKNQIILSCQSGKRSQIAAETLVNLGYKQSVQTSDNRQILLNYRILFCCYNFRIKNFKGSWLEWAEKNGLPK